MINTFLRYCSFQGRASRRENLMFQLMMIAVFVIAGLLTGVIAAVTHSEASLAIIVIVALLSIIPGIATTVRRLHDHNLSGWYILLIPIASFFIVVVVGVFEHLVLGTKTLTSIVSIVLNIGYLIFLFFIRGTKGPNKYGSDPLQLHDVQHVE